MSSSIHHYNTRSRTAPHDDTIHSDHNLVGAGRARALAPGLSVARGKPLSSTPTGINVTIDNGHPTPRERQPVAGEAGDGVTELSVESFLHSPLRSKMTHETKTLTRGGARVETGQRAGGGPCTYYESEDV